MEDVSRVGSVAGLLEFWWLARQRLCPVDHGDDINRRLFNVVDDTVGAHHEFATLVVLFLLGDDSA